MLDEGSAYFSMTNLNEEFGVMLAYRSTNWRGSGESMDHRSAVGVSEVAVAEELWGDGGDRTWSCDD